MMESVQVPAEAGPPKLSDAELQARAKLIARPLAIARCTGNKREGAELSGIALTAPDLPALRESLRQRREREAEANDWQKFVGWAHRAKAASDAMDKLEPYSRDWSIAVAILGGTVDEINRVLSGPAIRAARMAGNQQREKWLDGQARSFRDPRKLEAKLAKQAEWIAVKARRNQHKRAFARCEKDRRPRFVRPRARTSRRRDQDLSRAYSRAGDSGDGDPGGSEPEPRSRTSQPPEGRAVMATNIAPPTPARRKKAREGRKKTQKQTPKPSLPYAAEPRRSAQTHCRCSPRGTILADTGLCLKCGHGPNPNSLDAWEWAHRHLSPPERLLAFNDERFDDRRTAALADLAERLEAAPERVAVLGELPDREEVGI
jgi:hypothetical protein